MIKLRKGTKPKILADHSVEWTTALLTSAEASEYIKGRYRHPDIKAALLRETHEKCAYCESKFRHVTPGDVEHISPKSEAPALTFEWDNLTIACNICNNNKHATPAGTLVDPYVDDPDQFFRFAGTMIWPMLGIAKAEVTRAILKLNRGDLLEQRAKRLQSIHSQLNNIAKTTDHGQRKILLDDFRDNELCDESEYAMMVRAFFGTCT